MAPATDKTAIMAVLPTLSLDPPESAAAAAVALDVEVTRRVEPTRPAADESDWDGVTVDLTILVEGATELDVEVVVGVELVDVVVGVELVVSSDEVVVGSEEVLSVVEVEVIELVVGVSEVLVDVRVELVDSVSSVVVTAAEVVVIRARVDVDSSSSVVVDERDSMGRVVAWPAALADGFCWSSVLLNAPPARLLTSTRR